MKKYQEPTLKWGFDLTDFGSAKRFEGLLRRHNLISGYRRKKIKGDKWVSDRYEYIWENSKVRLNTSNNPLTGQYNRPSQRKKEKGYASYINVYGDEQAVRDLVKDIRRTATYIKGEQEGGI